MSQSIPVSPPLKMKYLTLFKALGFTFAMSLSSTGFTVADCVYIEKQNIKTLPLEEILEYVGDIYARNNQAGLMIGIIANDERAVVSCGETTVGSGNRPNMDSIWSIGSVSKIFTTHMLAA
ncbi:hypothetical protein [uncultured Legionella sp.]|uniref:hypothetical protein n=1 Tax=uncultured Legionella sp. TaxID=210934 RepID=UPI0026372897|nr:hypothetical protein [uncultured Legionella sp.]